jgi:hypothetical protein
MAKIAKATNERGSPLRALDHSMAGVETISEHSGQYERRQNPLDLVEDQRDCDHTNIVVCVEILPTCSWSGC